MSAKRTKKGPIVQEPSPGQRMLLFKGDRVVFRLSVDASLTGGAYVRTNIGQARISRDEIIRSVELNEAPLGRDWFDIPMRRSGPGSCEAVLPLNEVGHFEAKCFFLPEGQREPLWPEGPNTAINVEPADSVCGNIVYNAFVRQFGPHKACPRSDYSQTSECVKMLDESGYAVIPPSGTFRELVAELDFIMDRLGCRVVQLLPIHPTPTTFARMGRFGSPYAALSFAAVDPALAVFDPKATPLEQFVELVDAVHARAGKVIIDIAINHTGWAASLHETHPQWLARKATGEIENPGAWGVVWEDLTRLDYGHKDMWPYMADVFLTWCRRGVDGFRCDAGYMIPTPAWQYMIAKVREQFPDTVFLLEGLGGKISVTRDLLNRANFNWAYSELFQNYDRGQIEWYLSQALDISATDGITVHFAETHDNNRLAAVSPTYARMRTALCALLAPYGAFGFANGVEWLANEKINVHEACALNWGATDNQVEAIAHLSRLLKTHPAFGPSVQMRAIGRGQGNFIAVARRHRTSGRGVVVLANLDWERPVTARWNFRESGFLKSDLIDLLSGQAVTVVAGRENHRMTLAAGQVVCLADAGDPWRSTEASVQGVPAMIRQQRLHAKVAEISISRAGKPVSPDPKGAALALSADPEAFCMQLNGPDSAPEVSFWHYPEDLHRVVMVPPGHMLLLRAPHSFRARILDGDRVLATQESLTDDRGKAFVLFAPLDRPERHLFFDLETTVFDPQGVRHDKARLLYLATGRQTRVRTTFSRDDGHKLPLLVLGTNGRGAMMRVHADGGLRSRYDALLAANLNPDFPEDRHVMLARFRAWVVYQGFSREVNLDCLEQFGFDYKGGGWWRCQIPAGQGEHIVLQLRTMMLPQFANAVAYQVERLYRLTGMSELGDDQPVTLIIRPDIEDRNFHHTTKAFAGPEEKWPGAVAPAADGFRFSPAGERSLVVKTDNGRYVAEPEWYYMIHRSLEAERGLDPDSDLFSPGYFSCQLLGGQRMTLTAQVIGAGAEPAIEVDLDQPLPDDDLPLETALAAALDQYVVRRGAFHTVIAGFPWFLDWGRDTLIVVRGMIAAGRLSTTKAILLQFAHFEDQGTLPNMIRGSDAGNRDTSDAPLWFFTACADMVAAEGHQRFLSSRCNGRTVRRILIDIAHALMQGTPNGIVMDRASGLIFSPAHFTWMDTNYPAGTPRQGYPIEIQALWYAALMFLARIDKDAQASWRALAAKVKAAIHDLFWMPEAGCLSDCRHALPHQSAEQAQPDDALRPNQLLALTLGAVDDPAISRSVLRACQRLLVPGAVRSLADQPVRFPLEVRTDGRLLNDPVKPFWGHYLGDEDTRRKPAYHNGTAWTWPFPSFCEAWAACYGKAGREAALAWLSSSILLIDSHCVGHVPEIVDGHAPHLQRGCDAQAWGASELLRVWKALTKA